MYFSLTAFAFVFFDSLTSYLSFPSLFQSLHFDVWTLQAPTAELQFLSGLLSDGFRDFYCAISKLHKMKVKIQHCLSFSSTHQNITGPDALPLPPLTLMAPVQPPDVSIIHEGGLQEGQGHIPATSPALRLCHRPPPRCFPSKGEVILLLTLRDPGDEGVYPVVTQGFFMSKKDKTLRPCIDYSITSLWRITTIPP